MRIAINTTRTDDKLTVKLGILPNATFSVITTWEPVGKTYKMVADKLTLDVLSAGKFDADAVSEAASILNNLVTAELLPLTHDIKKFTTAVEAKHGRQVAVLPNGDLRTVGKIKEKEEGEKTFYPKTEKGINKDISVVATDEKDAVSKMRGRFLAEAVGNKKIAGELATWLAEDCPVEAAEDVKISYIDIHTL